MMVKTVVDGVVDSDIGSLDQTTNIILTTVQFSPVNTPGKVDFILN